MLHQNWFYQAGMKMIVDGPEVQVFYDEESKCFYSVEEICEGHIVIDEYSEGNEAYEKLKLLMETIDRIEGSKGSEVVG